MKNFWNELPRPFFILAPMEAVTDVVFRACEVRTPLSPRRMAETYLTLCWISARKFVTQDKLVIAASFL